MTTSALIKQEILQVKHLKKYFVKKPSLLEKLLGKQKDQVTYALDDVNLAIYKGETLGLVGESGCGKSTLGKTILKLHELTSGQILFKDQDITNISRKALHQYRKKVQIIFQNPYASLNPRKTVREILEVPLRFCGVIHMSDQLKEMTRLMERVGLSSRHLEQYPHQFSGGQRQRIGIARALALKPEFIVADEPVSALDVSVQAQIINLLEELKQEFQLTYLFVAHDLSVVHHVSDRVAVMYLGQIVEIADTLSLFDSPKHPYTQALLSSIPKVDEEQKKERIILQGTVPTPLDPPTGCRFHTRCFNKIGEICEQVQPIWMETNGHGVACHLYR